MYEEQSVHLSVCSPHIGPAGTKVQMAFQRPGGKSGTGPRHEIHHYIVELVRGKPGAVPKVPTSPVIFDLSINGDGMIRYTCSSVCVCVCASKCMCRNQIQTGFRTCEVRCR